VVIVQEMLKFGIAFLLLIASGSVRKAFAGWNISSR